MRLDGDGLQNSGSDDRSPINSVVPLLPELNTRTVLPCTPLQPSIFHLILNHFHLQPITFHVLPSFPSQATPLQYPHPTPDHSTALHLQRKTPHFPLPVILLPTSSLFISPFFSFVTRIVNLKFFQGTCHFESNTPSGLGVLNSRRTLGTCFVLVFCREHFPPPYCV